MKILLRSAVVLGLLSFAALPASASPILLNGGFETGNFDGWAVTPSLEQSLLYVGTVNPHSGDYSAVFAGTGGIGFEDKISQSFATTPGQSYRLEFWLTEDRPSCSRPLEWECRKNNFSAFWDGERIWSLFVMNPYDHTQFYFELVATGAISTLSFSGSDETGYTRLDDISVDAVPEPASLVLLGSGLAGLVARRRRRRRQDRQREG